MKYIAIANTDIGIEKKTNQDSVLIKQATFNEGEVLLAILCDGMGGLAKGELASATVIRAFSKWFDEELPYELEHLDLSIIGNKWSNLLKELNYKIIDYSKKNGIPSMGTTFSGILFVNNQYVFVHVGDSRIYEITNEMKQLTTDQTFIAREIARGTMTLEQAKVDKRRNLLLQCVGASDTILPEIKTGITKNGAYMLCSDGFRHEISNSEMYNAMNPMVLVDKATMYNNVKQLIELDKSRNEKDNISAILIKTI